MPLQQSSYLIIPLQRVRLLAEQVRPEKAADLPDNFEHCHRPHVHMRTVSPVP